MLVKVIGFENVSYSFDDGRTVNGVNAYYAVDIPKDKGTGHRVEKVFFHPEKFGFEGELVPAVYNIEFGRSRSGKAYLTAFSK